MPLLKQAAHSDWGEDARVLLNSVIYTVSVPYSAECNNTRNLTGFERQFIRFLRLVVIQCTHYQCAGLFWQLCGCGSRPWVWSIVWAWLSHVSRSWVLWWWLLLACRCNVLIIIPLIIRIHTRLPTTPHTGLLLHPQSSNSNNNSNTNKTYTAPVIHVDSPLQRRTN